MRISRVIIVALLIVGSFSLGCSTKTEQKKLKEGRCEANGDCPEGFACKDTFCEDIYHPRKDIKRH